MSVIGRMDKQVEEVLIAPIARRHEQKIRERENDEQAESGKTPPAPTEEKEQGGSEVPER